MRKRFIAGALLFLPVLIGAAAEAREPIDLYPQAAAAYAVAIDDQLV